MAVLLLLTACAPPTPVVQPTRPMRIVSLDYCADQYVLKLVDRNRIAAVSVDAGRAFSYMRASAIGIPRVASRAEDVLLLKPDLVVRSYGGGPGADAMLARARIKVVRIGYASDLAGVRRVLIETAEGLGEGARGRALAAEMDARLAAIRRPARPASVLYLTSGGVSAGRGTMIDTMIAAAGMRNYDTQAGWHPIPLEALARSQPDVIAAAFFGPGERLLDPWSAAAHPVAVRAMKDRPMVSIPGAWTACGGWFLVDTIEAMAKAGRGQ